jgi:protein-disulfide isomerase
MNNTGSGSTVSKMQDWAKSLGVKYVPTFFLDGEKFEGLQYYSDLRGRIEKVLED